MWNLEILLVAAGIFMFLYAFVVMRRIGTLLAQPAKVPASMIIGCRALEFLVLLFSCGYCLFFYTLITDEDLLFEINLVVSVIFFWGSVFVILSFVLFHSVLRHRIDIEDTLVDTTSQLVQSRKSEALGRLAGGVAHDFNNILMIISNYAEMSMRYAEGHPELTEALRNLAAGAEQGRGLTRQLLTFCRKRPVEYELISLADVVNESRSMLSELIPANITLAVSCRVPGWVAGAEDQIQLALINLVLNARDAMADGGQIAITLSYSDSESVVNIANGRKVLLEVADTGHGMDADTKARVFDPYFTTKKGGNGLGLSMVASTVEQHGGQLRVISDVGEGTRFQILLDDKEQLQDTTSAATEELATKSSSSGHKRTVIVADDDPRIRQVATRILSDAGYAVLVAGDGQEALSICDSLADRIDVLLTDFYMPGQTGIELAHIFVQKAPQAQVILMSGHPRANIGLTDSQEDTYRFLRKPFFAAELLELIEDVLEQG